MFNLLSLSCLGDLSTAWNEGLFSQSNLANSVWTHPRIWYGWTMCSVMGVSPVCVSVQAMDG